jgi:hypothetical protein
MRSFILTVAAALFVITGCVVHSDRSHEWIRERASRDFSCPQGQITVYHYTDKPHEKGAVGCGKRVLYVERCQGNRCTWEPDPSREPKKPK